ncbi:MAG TPA: hypothetical protein VEL07_14585 [Planctomycetota bacterium]|nr:hypothetical protein [Planctomycetota bacterium]
MRILHTDITRQGSTLFEVAISLAMLAFCVTGVLLAFPAGVQAQQAARFRLLAAAKAEEMVDAFNTIHNHNTVIDAEAPQPWETTAGRRAMAHDLETRLANPQTGLMPLPEAIARRLDSDAGEIARLLDDGGQIYYPQPMATTGVLEIGLGDVVANETQRLIVGVIGHAQSNAMHIFPWKAWPYYVPWPSPPLHGEHHHDGTIPATTQTYVFGRHGICWESTNDEDMEPVFDGVADDGEACGFKPYAYDAPPAQASLLRYVATTLWYCRAKGLPPAFWSPGSTAAPLDDLSTYPVAAHDQVNAMRFLAHAALCMTALWDSSQLTGAGVVVPSLTIGGTPSPPMTITHDLIGWYHDSSLALGMRFAAARPYDWGAPRPLQRAQQMDFPLLEYDLFPDAARPLLSGVIGDTGVSARQWRAIAAQPVRNLGRSFSFPVAPIPSQTPGDPDYAADADSIWGDSANFTLAKPFAPAERCRQLVFWAVDWQAYEDFELVPSGAIDAGRYNLFAPKPGAPFAWRMEGLAWWDFGLHTYRNPEKNLTFVRDVGGYATGASVADDLIKNAIIAPPDRGPTLDARRIFLGRHGADRNFNKRLDRGPVPASARMRARLIARFNIYDPRAPNVLR